MIWPMHTTQARHRYMAPIHVSMVTCMEPCAGLGATQAYSLWTNRVCCRPGVEADVLVGAASGFSVPSPKDCFVIVSGDILTIW
jgi:hypothetical protein